MRTLAPVYFFAIAFAHLVSTSSRLQHGGPLMAASDTLTHLLTCPDGDEHVLISQTSIATVTGRYSTTLKKTEQCAEDRQGEL